jgi:hypothetical protein
MSAVFDPKTWRKVNILDEFTCSYLYSACDLSAAIGDIRRPQGRPALVEPAPKDGEGLCLWATQDEGRTFFLVYDHEFEEIPA